MPVKNRLKYEIIRGSNGIFQSHSWWAMRWRRSEWNPGLIVEREFIEVNAKSNMKRMASRTDDVAGSCWRIACISCFIFFWMNSWCLIVGKDRKCSKQIEGWVCRGAESTKGIKNHEKYWTWLWKVVVCLENQGLRKLLAGKRRQEYLFRDCWWLHLTLGCCCWKKKGKSWDLTFSGLI